MLNRKNNKEGEKADAGRCRTLGRRQQMSFSPSLGRWLQQDPIGFDAGDSNLYRYVGNGPTDRNDPSGEFSVPPEPETGQTVDPRSREYIEELLQRILKAKSPDEAREIVRKRLECEGRNYEKVLFQAAVQLRYEVYSLSINKEATLEKLYKKLGTMELAKRELSRQVYELQKRLGITDLEEADRRIFDAFREQYERELFND
jgi:RHS repeat-associated protein